MVQIWLPNEGARQIESWGPGIIPDKGGDVDPGGESADSQRIPSGWQAQFQGIPSGVALGTNSPEGSKVVVLSLGQAWCYTRKTGTAVVHTDGG